MFSESVILSSMPSAQYVALMSIRRTPVLSRSVDEPMVVVKTRAVLPDFPV